VFGPLRVWVIHTDRNKKFDEYGGADEEMEPFAGLSHVPGSRTKPTIPSWEVGLYWLAAIVQLPLPAYVWYMSSSWQLCLFTLGASCCISIAWLPGLQRNLRKCDKTVHERREKYLPSLPKTARVWAHLFNSLMRIVFTVVYIAIYVRIDTSFAFTSVADAFAGIGRTGQLTPFLVQIFSSFFGYQAARLACLLTMQRYSFALPLFMSTPVTLLVFIFWNDFPLFTLVRALVSCVALSWSAKISH
jgi:hypothetical protein